MQGTSIVLQNIKPSNAQRVIAWFTGILTLLLALFSFVLSFNALTDLAQAHGVSIPPLFPFVVEAAVVVFSLNALYRSLHGEGAKTQWVLIIGSSLLAGLFNVAHAQADWLSRLMAAMPSLFLLLSFESFLSLIKYQVTRQGSITSMAELNRHALEISTSVEQKSQQAKELDTLLQAKQQQHDTLQAQIAELQRQYKQAQIAEISPNDTTLQKANDTRQAQISERREQVLNLLKEDLSQAEIAEIVGVSLATVKRDIKTLNGRVNNV